MFKQRNFFVQLRRTFKYTLPFGSLLWAGLSETIRVVYRHLLLFHPKALSYNLVLGHLAQLNLPLIPCFALRTSLSNALTELPAFTSMTRQSTQGRKKNKNTHTQKERTKKINNIIINEKKSINYYNNKNKIYVK